MSKNLSECLRRRFAWKIKSHCSDPIAEEVLSSNQALWMSDDGHLMLYATFNDTLVEEQRFPWFAVQDEGKLYPEIRSLRYPKVTDYHCLSESLYRILYAPR
jgi:hypothetical protein